MPGKSGSERPSLASASATRKLAAPVTQPAIGRREVWRLGIVAPGLDPARLRNSGSRSRDSVLTTNRCQTGMLSARDRRQAEVAEPVELGQIRGGGALAAPRSSGRERELAQEHSCLDRVEARGVALVVVAVLRALAVLAQRPARGRRARASSVTSAPASPKAPRFFAG